MISLLSFSPFAATRSFLYVLPAFVLHDPFIHHSLCFTDVSDSMDCNSGGRRITIYCVKGNSSTRGGKDKRVAHSGHIRTRDRCGIGGRDQTRR